MNLILVIAAVIVSALVFTWLLKVVKATLSTAFILAFILLVLQLAFGLGPQDLWQQILDLVQNIWRR
ncbi:MAG: hypothetical protein F6K19_04185 [Cyanothece sp. SIO1E1]|nr:hypothetical protein [Cyanothece sp. SIO1E1]